MPRTRIGGPPTWAPRIRGASASAGSDSMKRRRSIVVIAPRTRRVRAETVLVITNLRLRFLGRDNGAAPQALRGFTPLNHVFFAGADAVALLDWNHEHASVADLAGTCRLHDRADHLVDRRVFDHDFDLHLRQQADVVLLAAVDRRVPLLLAVAAHLGDRHP